MGGQSYRQILGAATYLEFEIKRKANTADPMSPIDFVSDIMFEDSADAQIAPEAIIFHEKWDA